MGYIYGVSQEFGSKHTTTAAPATPLLTTSSSTVFFWGCLLFYQKSLQSCGLNTKITNPNIKKVINLNTVMSVECQLNSCCL